MELNRTRVTRKFQTTIPRGMRRRLGIEAGEHVEWHVVKELVVVRASRKVAHATDFLCSQTRAGYDAVALVRAAREEI